MTSQGRPMPASRAERGFTLLEILVATAIFAIAAQLAFGGLRHILHAREQLVPRQDSAAGLRYAVSLLTHDIEAAVPRAVRDALGGPAAALQTDVDDALVVLSRLDAARATLLDGVAVRRVGYVVRDGELVRLVWPVVDVVQGTRPTAQVLLAGVRELRLRFLGTGAVAWSDLWPVASDDPGALPRAVDFELVFDDGSTLRRLLLPGRGA